MKWVVEGTVSTIPAGWILEPEALPPNDRLPVKGKCCWKRKGNSLEILVSKYLLILTVFNLKIKIAFSLRSFFSNYSVSVGKCFKEGG